MSATDAFFDTNILVYLVSSDLEKARRSEALLAGGGTVSVQVLNEFASAARRKTKLSFAEIRAILADVRRICAVKPVDVETHELGLDIAERYRCAVYDGVIIAAALRAGCSVLFSEDFQHGQRIEGLTIRNPFRETTP
jgi:predicted nucleic acid-binding protein